MEFFYRPVSFDNGESFYFEDSIDGGDNWTIVQSWTRGVHFSINGNEILRNGYQLLPATFDPPGGQNVVPYLPIS
jgi:hypothetical protein